MDLGEAASALIVRITQKKLISPRAELEATKHTVLSGGYADNYSYSFRTLEEFRRVSSDMEKIHNRLTVESNVRRCWDGSRDIEKTGERK